MLKQILGLGVLLREGAINRVGGLWPRILLLLISLQELGGTGTTQGGQLYPTA